MTLPAGVHTEQRTSPQGLILQPLPSAITNKMRSHERKLETLYVTKSRNTTNSQYSFSMKNLCRGSCWGHATHCNFVWSCQWKSRYLSWCPYLDIVYFCIIFISVSQLLDLAWRPHRNQPKFFNVLQIFLLLVSSYLLSLHKIKNDPVRLGCVQ